MKRAVALALAGRTVFGLRALQALGVAAKKLEDETKELIDVHRARQPWLRRWRW